MWFLQKSDLSTFRDWSYLHVLQEEIYSVLYFLHNRTVFGKMWKIDENSDYSLFL